MDEGPNPAPESDSDAVDKDRREFLRKSIYAAYATPLITALLVEEASAASSNSQGRGSADWCRRHPDKCAP